MQLLNKLSIFDFTIEQLKTLVTKANFKPYLAQQLFEWIYSKRVIDFEKMTNISINTRTWLKEHFESKLLKECFYQSSVDGTVKFLFELADGNKIETVLAHFNDGYLVYVATQVNCSRDSSLANLSSLKKYRNLETFELVLQVYMAQLYLDQYHLGKVTNIVVNWNSEQFDNLNNVSDFIDIVNNNFAFEISKRKITVLTSGLVNCFEELVKVQPKVKLAISLYGSNDQVYNSLIATNKDFKIANLIAAAKTYTEQTKNQITFEYIMIDTVNNKEEHAYELVNLLKEIFCHVNLIPSNTLWKNKHLALKKLDTFAKILISNGIRCTKRIQNSSEINPACTQIRAKEQGVL